MLCGAWGLQAEMPCAVQGRAGDAGREDCRTTCYMSPLSVLNTPQRDRSINEAKQRDEAGPLPCMPPHTPCHACPKTLHAPPYPSWFRRGPASEGSRKLPLR